MLNAVSGLDCLIAKLVLAEEDMIGVYTRIEHLGSPGTRRSHIAYTKRSNGIFQLGTLLMSAQHPVIVRKSNARYSSVPKSWPLMIDA